MEKSDSKIIRIQQDAELNTLLDPSKFCEPIHLEGTNTDQLFRALRMMLIVRKVEEKIGDAVASGGIKCPCHLGIGQEAIPVAISEHLKSSDKVFGGHRSHSHYLALGGGVYELFAEVLGRLTGCSKGMGGSMHLVDLPHGFIGSVPIVAATVPMAVGAALAAQKDRRGDIAVAYFGDGASEEGAVHEAMNFAAIYQLPILFVCENNLFSSHLHVNLRQPSPSIARFAKAHKIPNAVVDGNDVVTVSKKAQELIAIGRKNQGPAFLEAITYRWRGHVGAREDIDVGVQRNTDLALWKKRDPVARLVKALEMNGTLDEKKLTEISQEIQKKVDHEWERALEAPFPDKSQLMSVVYAN